ncbi:MAG: nucleoside phosphorylase, partial [Oscillospiraceae bacterium]
ELHSCAGELPIWRVRRNGREYGVFLAMPGGPMIIGQIEEFGAMGGRNFVLFGSCGVLDAHIDHGNIILPAAAVRDEGVSYQYIAPADEIALSEDAVAAAEEALKSLGYPYIKGKTWTTDCFYRETRGKMETRIAGGCIAVEMECASAAAVTEFRGYRFAQFLFAADNLASEVWERRNLSDKGIHSCDLYLNAAFAIGDNLSMLSDNS